MRTSLFLTICVLVAGCYNYNPLAAPSPEQGASVAVTLTNAGTENLAPAIGPNVFVVRGRYVGSDGDAVQLSVTSVELIRGDEIDWRGERVTVPNDDIASIQVRQLAKGRSVLLVGVGVTGLVATTVAFALNGGQNLGGASGPPPVKK